MTNDQEVEKISKMTLEELFAYVMAWPDCLTDSYFRVFGRAIEKRYEELKKHE